MTVAFLKALLLILPEKSHRKLVMTADIPFEVRTRYLMDRQLDPYRYANLFAYK
jgi:hypothetical protein